MTQPTLPAAALDRVERDPQVSVAAGEVQAEARIVGADGEIVGQAPYFGVGYDFARRGAADLTPFRLESGRWPAGPRDVVIDAKTSRDENLDPGDTVSIAADGAPVRGFASSASRRSARCVARAPRRPRSSTWKPPSACSTSRAGSTRSSHRLAPAPHRRLSAGLDQRLPASERVRSAAAQDRFTLDGLKEFVGILRTILLVLGLVAVVVGAFTIANALAMSVAQQQRSLALLRAIGASRRQVRRLVALQALALGLAGCVLGLIVGVGLAHGLGAMFDALGLSLPTTTMTLAGSSVLIAVLVGVGVPLLASLRPARLATRISPVSAMREATDGARPGLFGRGVRAIASVLGRPAELLGGVAGSLARRNTMRRPGRTRGYRRCADDRRHAGRCGRRGRGRPQGLGLERGPGPHRRRPRRQQREGRLGPDVGRRAAARRGGSGRRARRSARAGRSARREDARDGRRSRHRGGEAGALRHPAGRGELRPGEALVTESLARERDLDVGGRLTLLAPNGDRVTVTVAGLAAASKLERRRPRRCRAALGHIHGLRSAADELRYGLVETSGDTGAVRAAIARSLEGFPGAYVDTTENWARPRLRGSTSC